MNSVTSAQLHKLAREATNLISEIRRLDDNYDRVLCSAREYITLPSDIGPNNEPIEDISYLAKVQEALIREANKIQLEEDLKAAGEAASKAAEPPQPALSRLLGRATRFAQKHSL